MVMRALHLFAGAGGAVIAFRALGIESVGAVEIDPFCCEVLKHHGEKVLGTDVRSFNATGLVGDVDIVTGGWPCQGNSVAGKRRGLEDDRSNLWWELLRILKESRAPYLFAENVRGALSVNSGRDFRTVLRSLDDAGYDARWIVTSAAASGAPHKRERLWLFAWRREVGDPARGGFAVLGRAEGARSGGHDDLAGEGGDLAHSDPGRREQRDEGQRLISVADAGSGESTVGLATRCGRERCGSDRQQVMAAQDGARTARRAVDGPCGCTVAHAGVDSDERRGVPGGVPGACGAVEGGEGLSQQRAALRSGQGVVDAHGERLKEQHVPSVAERPRLALAERDVADAGQPRLQGVDGSASGDEPRQHRERRDVGDSMCRGGERVPIPTTRNDHEASGAGDPRGPSTAQRGMGGADNGLAHGLGDWPAGRGLWPAGRGAPQHSWEAPRVVAKRAKGDLQALKALGNGWVPSQAINAWLELTGAFDP